MWQTAAARCALMRQSWRDFKANGPPAGSEITANKPLNGVDPIQSEADRRRVGATRERARHGALLAGRIPGPSPARRRDPHIVRPRRAAGAGNRRRHVRRASSFRPAPRRARPWRTLAGPDRRGWVSRPPIPPRSPPAGTCRPRRWGRRHRRHWRAVSCDGRSCPRPRSTGRAWRPWNIRSRGFRRSWHAPRR